MNAWEAVSQFGRGLGLGDLERDAAHFVGALIMGRVGL